MSMDRCHECDQPVDTDNDTDCYQPHPSHSLKGFADICICERCRERLGIGEEAAEEQDATP